MRLQIVDTANFKVAEQFTDPTTGALETGGTKELRIYEIDWATPQLKIYDWDDNTFKTGAPTDDEGTMAHHQAGGINTGVWISPEITQSVFVAGTDYIFQFLNVDDTVYQSYEIRFQGAALAVNLVQIDGQATTGNNATLSLKQLNIVNSAGTALVAQSTGGNGNGISALGAGTGAGLAATGGATDGHGLVGTGQGSGHGLRGVGGAGVGVGISGNGNGTGPGLLIAAGGTNTHGAQFNGVGTGSGVRFVGGATGRGILAEGGATSGPGIEASSISGNGVTATGGGTGHGIAATSGSGATGDGINASAASTNGDGIRTTKAGTGKDLRADTLVDDIWDEVLTGATHNVPSSSGRRLRGLEAFAVSSDTAQAGTASTITLAAGEPATNDIYQLNYVTIFGGTGAGQTRVIVDYNGTSKVATVARNWITNPAGDSEYAITSNANSAVLDVGAPQAVAAGTITLRATASADNGAYVGALVAIVAGTGREQVRVITAYNGTTKVATIDADWTTNPDTASGYIIWSQGRNLMAAATTAGANAVRDAILSDATAFAGANIDAAISSRSSHGDPDPSGFIDAAISSRSSHGDPDPGGLIANLDATITSRQPSGAVDLNADQSGVTIGTVNSVAAAGRNAIADSYLDRTNGIEAGITPRQYMRGAGAVLCGIAAGGPGGSVFDAMGNDGTNRVTSTADTDGDRSAVTLALT